MIDTNVSPSRIVLQGEYAVVDGGNPGACASLKSSGVSVASLLTLHGGTRPVAIMAFIDDYTSVCGMINQIELCLRREFTNSSLSQGVFTAHLIGGSEDPFSQEQRQAVLEILGRLFIETTEVPLEGATRQVVLNGASGEIAYLAEETINQTLEWTQSREYGEFQNFLDVQFPVLSDSQIPYFEPKEASRFEPSDRLRRFSSVLVIPPDGSGVSRSKNWRDIARSVSSLLEIDLQPDRVPVPVFEQTAHKVESLIASASFCKSKPLKESLIRQNFSLMLRQTAVSTKYISLFRFLLENASALSIDLTERGKKSGSSVWDVAESRSNEQALDLLANA